MGLTVDFKIDHTDNSGIYYSETKRALIYLPMHETIEDVIKTVNHEVFHHCFEVYGQNVTMDEDQEEKLIFFLQWADVAL
mgnify:FL=1